MYVPCDSSETHGTTLGLLGANFSVVCVAGDWSVTVPWISSVDPFEITPGVVVTVVALCPLPIP